MGVLMSVFEPHFTITNTMTTGLTAIERARGFLEAAILSDEWVWRVSQRAILLEAHHTTHIEGTELTLEQAAELWYGRAVPEAQPDDVRELLNYRDAFELVAQYLESGEPITEGLIREIHRRLVVGVRGEAGDPGRYRTIQNQVVNSVTRAVIYTPPPPQEVPALMRELVLWLRQETAIHPVLQAGIAQFQLVHIHPFVDGNGRTSRLLSTLVLYRAGYDFKQLFTLSEYYDRDRPAFYRALQGVRDAGLDLTGWLDYFVTGLATQLTEIHDRGALAIRADSVARQYQLSARQAAVLTEIVAARGMTLSALAQLFPAVTRRTLQRDLKLLRERGLIREIGSSATDPNRQYLPAEL